MQGFSEVACKPNLRFFQLPWYKTFDDYIDIQPLSSRESQFTAKEKKNNRKNDECYDDKWYLLLRAGLYRAQLEKAMSEIYQHFLGYATDIEIIKKQNDYYVASRAIARYTSFFDCSQNLKLAADGSLLYEGCAIVGLGKICALTKFFGDNDSAPGNFGVQFLKNQKKYRAFKIDSEKSLMFEDESGEDDENDSLEREVKTLTTLFLKTDITQVDWFKKEKAEMLDQLAASDFSVIEKILRKNITTSVIESFRWLANQQQGIEEKNKMLGYLDQLKPEELKNYELDGIIEKLREQHRELRKERLQTLQFRDNTLRPV